MLESCSEVEQRTLLYTIIEGRDIGDELHVDDVALFGGIGIAEDLEGEGCLGDLRDVYWCGSVARNVRGAIGGGAAGSCMCGWCGCGCNNAARLSNGHRCDIGVGSGCAIGNKGR